MTQLAFQQEALSTNWKAIENNYIIYRELPVPAKNVCESVQLVRGWLVTVMKLKHNWQYYQLNEYYIYLISSFHISLK